MKKLQQDKWIDKFGEDNTYNIHCNHICKIDGEFKCGIKMEMMFCSNKCIYATNVKGTYKVDKKGKVIGIND